MLKSKKSERIFQNNAERIFRNNIFFFHYFFQNLTEKFQFVSHLLHENLCQTDVSRQSCILKNCQKSTKFTEINTNKQKFTEINKNQFLLILLYRNLYDKN